MDESPAVGVVAVGVPVSAADAAVANVEFAVAVVIYADSCELISAAEIEDVTQLRVANVPGPPIARTFVAAAPVPTPMPI